MAYVPGYEYDLFVSYAHVDNAPLSPKPEGRWVSALVQQLEKVLAQKLGRGDALKIWFDHANLQGNHELSGHIPKEVERSALILSVLSPGYVASKWCLRELSTFVQTRKDTISGRLFGVKRAPLDSDDEMPLEFRDQRNYTFWWVDMEKRLPRTYAVPVPHPETEPDYWCLIDDLARDIKDKLRELVRATPEPPVVVTAAVPSAIPASDAKAIVLAEVAADLQNSRREVQRYLSQLGVEALPTRPYPTDRVKFVEALTADLARSKLFVQLLGSSADDGLAAHQYEVARKQRAQILQWRSPDLALGAVESPLQRMILDQDTVQAVPLADFKQTIGRMLRPAAPPPPVLPPYVFINADPADAESAHQIQEELGDDVFSMVPLHDAAAKAEELQKEIEDNLVQCDGLIIVYGTVRPTWVHRQVQLYRKLAPMRSRPPRVLAVVETSPTASRQARPEPPNPKPPLGIRFPGLAMIDATHGLREAIGQLKVALAP